VHRRSTAREGLGRRMGKMTAGGALGFERPESCSTVKKG
jgi:hypothetical protein